MTTELHGVELHRSVAARLAEHDQQYTANRRAIVDALATAAGPITLPDLLAADDSLAQSSAYRNLAVLEKASVVHRIVTTDELARYELAEDLTHHHHHLICSSCGDVTDFEVPSTVEEELEAALARVARRTGFQVRTHRLDLVGTCPSCS